MIIDKRTQHALGSSLLNVNNIITNRKDLSPYDRLEQAAMHAPLRVQY